MFVWKSVVAGQGFNQPGMLNSRRHTFSLMYKKNYKVNGLKLAVFKTKNIF